MSSGAVATPGGTTRRIAAAWSLRPGWVALVAVGVVSIAVGSIPRSYQYAPLVASVVVLGLPHGAVDHLVAPRQRDEPLTPRWLGVVGGVYFLLGAAYAAVWFYWPLAAFGFFILLTLLHWGQGELYPLVTFLDAAYLHRPGQRALTVLVRGGAPMLVPLVAFPAEYEFVAGTLVGLFDPGAEAALGPLFEPRARLLVGAGYATLLLVTLVLGYVRTDALGPWLLDAGELALLTGFFLVVPPILAIGVYFSFWHSLRHVSRTVLLDDRSVAALDRGRIRPVLSRFARDAAPMTAGALALFGGLYLLIPTDPSGTPEFVGLYLVLIAVLTLPHVAIVTWLDRAQGVL
jgi:Brp/Blh family beta-carotene 15,15'-monooxygenase